MPRSLDRRRFVALTASAFVAGATGGCASIQTVPVTPADGRVHLSIRNYPQLSAPGGHLRVQPNGIPSSVLVMRLEDGDYAALSSICTHLECVVNVEGPRIVCPCHGSEFDRDGSLLEGPAERPLTRYPTMIEGGVLVIDLTTTT